MFTFFFLQFVEKHSGSLRGIHCLGQNLDRTCSFSTPSLMDIFKNYAIRVKKKQKKKRFNPISPITPGVACTCIWPPTRSRLPIILCTYV